MKLQRTKRLTERRAKEILQLRYGTQVYSVIKDKEIFQADEVLGKTRYFTRNEILNIEDEIYKELGN